MINKFEVIPRHKADKSFSHSSDNGFFFLEFLYEYCKEKFGTFTNFKLI